MNQKFFEKKIRTNPRPIIVEFWAPWCGPCKMMAPSLKKAADDFDGKVDLWKINADQEPEILQKLGVRGIPTMIGYFEGKEITRKTGAMTPENVHAFFSAVAEQKPFIRNLSWVERVIRILLAVAVGLIAWLNGPIYWLLGVAAVILFSAVYDQCPVYKVVKLQFQSWLKRKRTSDGV